MATTAPAPARTLEPSFNRPSGVAHRLSRDHPIIWFFRLDLALAYAVLGTLAAVGSAYLAPHLLSSPFPAESFVEAGFFIWFSLSTLFAVYWVYSIITTILLLNAPALPAGANFALIQLAGFVIIVPSVTFQCLACNVLGIGEFPSDLFPLRSPGLVLWSITFCYTTSCLAYVSIYFGIREALLSTIIGVIFSFALLLAVSGLFVSPVILLCILASVYPLVIVLLRYRASAWFGILYPSLLLAINPLSIVVYLFAPELGVRLEAGGWSAAYAYEHGALLASVVVGWSIAWFWQRKRHHPVKASTAPQAKDGSSAPGRRKQDRLLRPYYDWLSREHPRTWSLRFDLVTLFFVLLSAMALLGGLWSKTAPKREAYDDVQEFERELFSFMGSADLTIFVFGTLVLLLYGYWSYCVGDTLRLPNAPSLRRIPHVFSMQSCVLLFSLPILLAFVLSSTAVDVALAKGHPEAGGATTGPLQEGAFIVASVLAVASALGAFASLHHRWGFLDALMAIVVALVAAGVAVLVSDLTGVFDPQSGATAAAAGLVLLALAWPRGSRSVVTRRLVHGPAHVWASTGVIFFALAPTFGWRVDNLRDVAVSAASNFELESVWTTQLAVMWPVQLAVLVMGYLLSAVLMQSLADGFWRHARPQKR